MDKVIFDTNAYRKFVSGKSLQKVRTDIMKINILESEAGIVAYQSIVVLSELFKHLIDKTDINYQECKLAVIASIFHCGKSFDGQEAIPYVPVWDKIMYYELTGHYLNEEQNSNYENSILFLAQLIAKQPYDSTIEDHKNALEINSRNFSFAKKTMFDALLSGIEMLEPRSDFKSFLKSNKEERRKITDYFKSKTFEYNLSQVLLEGVKAKYNLNNVVDKGMVEKFIDKYMPLIQLHRKLYSKIVNGVGILDESHKEFNTFYDAFIVAGSLLFEKCLFVTNEKQLIQSFNEVGMGNNVMSLEQYLESIGYKL